MSNDSVTINPVLQRSSGVLFLLAQFAPSLAGLGVFLAGMVVILTGVYPVLPDHLPVLTSSIPLPVVEAAHALASLCGLGLLVLAHGLMRRSQGAWALTLTTLSFAAVFCVLRAVDLGIAAGLLGLAGLVLMMRKSFYRPARAFAEPLSLGSFIAIMAVIGASILAGWLAYADAHMQDNVLLHFGFRGDEPRFWRASVLLSLAAFVMGISRLQAAPDLRVSYAGADKLRSILPIIAREPSAHAWLALLGDKDVLISKSGEAFLMYGARGRTLVAMGDPCGDPAEFPELLWRFRELADQRGGYAAFVNISAQNLPLYLDLGLAIRKLGEEARVDLTQFNTEGKSWRNMRNNRSALLRRGFTVEIIPPEGVNAIMPILAQISDRWRTRQNGPEKGFTLGRFDPNYIRNFPVAVARLDGDIIAFANLWQGADQHEIAVDLMRHLPNAPHGVMDVMFIELMLWAKAQGYHWFSLGGAPLSGLAEHPLAPFWSKLGGLVFRKAKRFYRFEGLRAYKQKFGPQWQPYYIATPTGGVAMKVVLDITALVSQPERVTAPRL